jgi:teichuronic acid exporter
MSLKLKAASGVFWNISANGFNQLVNFFVYLLLARLLNVEDFGLVAFAFLVIEFSTIFVTLGINQNLIQRAVWCDKFASSAFWLTLILSSSLALILVLCVAPATYFLYSPQAAYLILALAILPVFTGFRLTHVAKLQREFHNKKIAGIESLAILIGGGISVILALEGYQAWALVFGRIAQSIVDMLLIWYKTQFWPSWQIHREDIKEITSFGLPLVYMSLLTFFSTKAMNIVVGLFLGPVMFAFLTLARRPFMVLQNLLMQQLNKITFAAVSRVPDDDVPSVYYRILSLTAFFVIPVYLGFGAVSEPFINLFLDEKWQPSISLMYLLCLQAPAFIIYWYLPALLVSRAQTKSALNINIIVCLSNIIFALGGAFFGVQGVIIGVILAGYLSLPIRFKIISKFIDISLWQSIKQIVPFVFSGFLMYFVVLWLSVSDFLTIANPVVKFISLIIVGGIIYLTTLLILFSRNLKAVVIELKQLKN